MLCSICAARLPLNQPGFISQTRIVLEGHKTHRNGRRAWCGWVQSRGRSGCFFFFFFFLPLLHWNQSANTANPKAAAAGPGWYYSDWNIKKVTMLTMSCADTECENSVFMKKKCLACCFFVLLSVREEIFETLWRFMDVVRSVWTWDDSEIKWETMFFCFFYANHGGSILGRNRILLRTYESSTHTSPCCKGK